MILIKDVFLFTIVDSFENFKGKKTWEEMDSQIFFDLQLVENINPTNVQYHRFHGDLKDFNIILFSHLPTQT